jgi:uncharacterized membrane protein
LIEPAMPLRSERRPGTQSDRLELDDAQRAVLDRHASVIADRHHPDVALTASHVFRPPSDMTAAQGLGLLAAMALVLLSGFATGHLIEAFGVRAAAVLLFALATGASVGLGGISLGGGRPLSVVERFAILGTLTLAIATGAAAAIAMVPAVVHLLVARVFAASLLDDETLIEKAARMAHPLAPPFIAPYCRKLTAVWAGLFAASAVITAVLAIRGLLDAHRAWTGWIFWTVLAIFSLVEFLWRKAWFRYYGPGPFDRFLSRVFPPGNTPRGRRSAAYVASMRSELARLAEAKRTATRNARPLNER